MNRRSCAIVCLLILTLTPPRTAAQQAQPYPDKVVYADAAGWPATAPGEVRLKNFRPFRAVYDRTYTQAGGTRAGEKRQDRVIVTAEEVGWDGRRAIAISLIDSAAAEFADTNMRALTMVAALDDLSALFEIGPVPGKAKDYYLGRVADGSLLVSIVKTDSQELTPQKYPAPKPGFGPGSWVMASMKLRQGMKINLAPYYSPQANPISQSNYGRVLERKMITDGSGQQHEAWVVETSGWHSLDSPKVLRLHLQADPPYYLGTETYSYDTGEAKPFVWLRDARITER